MFKEITILLLLTLFWFSSCDKKVVDTEIPQMYKLNLKIELEGKNALDSLSLSQVRESVLKWPNEKEAVFNAEFTAVEEETLTSPLKTGVFKSREFGYELLILKGRKPNEKIKVYGGPDRFCDQTGRDGYPR